MRKIIIAIIVLLGVNSMDAQVKYGMKVGLNIANLNIDEAGFPSTSPIMNLHIGGFAEIMLNKKVAFQPELIYSAQGTKFDYLVVDGGNVYNTENTFKLAYINIPLMIKYYPETKFFVEAGPQVGFLASAKYKIKVDGYGSDTQDAKELFKDIDFGLNIGAGYNITKQITTNFRYNLGLANIAETDGGDTKIHNSVISLSIGFVF